MIILAGRLCIGVALLGAVSGAVSAWLPAAAPWRRRGPLIAFAGLLAAFILLEVALFTDNFGVRFVASHHRRETGALFTFTSAWAGLEGSLLLWATIIAGYLAVVSRQARPTDRLAEVASSVMSAVAAFFATLVLIVTPTFSASPRSVSDGRGANPLLQDNMLMAVHPPLLYLGYVGMLVPFAFAVAALLLRERGPRWVLRTQRWAVVAWGFLTAGIVIGGWWSYDVLGWGGYWAWDPVENASFLPWLVATAYLHSAVMHARRGLLPAWSVGLVVSTFLFTLLGTFLARSGVIASVHAFSGSSLGPVLLVFLVVVTVAVGWLFVSRLGDVITGPALQSLASREGMFLVNNLLLATFAAVVGVGTLYPIIHEAVNGARLTVGRPFFDVFAVWITLALLLAMIIGVVAPYRRAAWSEVWDRQRAAATVGLAVGAGLVVFAGLRAPYVIVVVVLATTIVASAAVELVRSARARLDHRGARTATGAALRARPGFWGGQVAHVGLAVTVIGIAASSNLAQRSTVTLSAGQSVAASGFTVSYLRPTAATEPTFRSRGVKVSVARGGTQRTLNPQLRTYPNQRESLAKPDVWTRWQGDDAYVAIVALDDSSVTLHVYRYPWMWLVWAGGLTMAAGAVAGLLLRRLRRLADRDVGAPTDVDTVPAMVDEVLA